MAEPSFFLVYKPKVLQPKPPAKMSEGAVTTPVAPKKLVYEWKEHREKMVDAIQEIVTTEKATFAIDKNGSSNQTIATKSRRWRCGCTSANTKEPSPRYRWEARR